MAGFAVPLLRAGTSPRLNVSFDGDNLHVAAPQLHFLTGQPLNRLHDGSTVVFLSQLTLLREDHASVFRKALERLTVSYDVWEEKFRVTMGTGGPSASRLSAAAAETWCLDNLAISALGLEPQRPFWLRFELRAEDPRNLSSILDASGISLTGMIEVFSRKPRSDEQPWTLEAGPLRLSDLKSATNRRLRKG